MDNLNKSLEKAVDSLEEVIKGITRKESITPADLEYLSKSICTVERIRNIQREEQSKDFNDYSENSYRRGRSRNYRDSGISTRRYYDSNGYSGHSIKDRMIGKLEKMFDETQSDHEKQVVQKWIDRLTYDF